MKNIAAINRRRFLQAGILSSTAIVTSAGNHSAPAPLGSGWHLIRFANFPLTRPSP